MATITWGNAVADATNAFRIGWSATESPSTVSSGTTTVSVALTIYLQTKYFANDSGADWTITGAPAASGSTAFDHNSSTAWSSSNITTLATRTFNVTTSLSGPVVSSGTATVTGLAAIAGTASVSWSVTVDQRPVSIPAAPTIGTVTRTSDTSHTVPWTNNSPTSPTAPYTGIDVLRSTDGGAFTVIKSLGVVSSYTDTTTSANHQYQYRVRSKNGAGVSAQSASSNTMKTTPSAPTGVSATKGTTDITVTWTDTSPFNDTFEVWHLANGVLDGAALATVANGVGSYTHVAPSTSVTHTYRLKSKTTTPALTSAFSADSNVVSLSAPPSAPTQLNPNGQARDYSGPNAFQWQYNSADTTAQRQYEIQYRIVGAPTWTSTGVVVSSVPLHSMAGGVLVNGNTYEWQVRTWGQNATAGAWSASATTVASAKPIATITNPSGPSFNSSQLTATWGYSDAEGTPQAAWEARLYVEPADTLVEALTGAGTAGSVTFAQRTRDQTSYQLEVRVQDGHGVWSDWDIQAFLVTYATPEIPTTALTWNDADDSVTVAIDNPPTTGGHVDAISNDLWRSIDGGPWALVATGLPPDAVVVDPIPAIGLPNAYKVIAFSALPSSISSDTGDRPELVTNGSFETDTSGWTPALGTVAAVANALATSGTNVMEYTSTSAATNGGNTVTSPYMPVTAGLDYFASAYVGVPVGSNIQTMRISVQYADASSVVVGSTVPGVAQVMVAGGAMQWVTVENVVPTGVAITQARLIITATPASGGVTVGGKFRVDQVSMKEIPPPVPSVSASNPTGAVVNAGPAFSMAAKLSANIEASITSGRTKVLNTYAGRTKPVERTGKQTSKVVSLSASLSRQLGTPELEQLEAIALQSAPACYRDPDGRRIFVSMGEVGVSGLGKAAQSLSWTLTEVDYTETIDAS